MARPLKILGVVAGAVALVAGSIATAGIGTAAFVAVAGKVATAAGIAATAANIGSSLLQKPPPVRGSPAEVIVAHDPPMPYVMGEGYVGMVLRHDAAWGPTIKKVPNPYRAMIGVLSGCGPVDSFSPRYGQLPVSSWYSGFLWTQTQLGHCPESAALSPQWSGMPGWGAAAKLSGQAAIVWSFFFDKDGKRFASGIDELGGYGRWVRVYDPRLDDTFPGGSGACRLGVEATYVWSENPALHAGTYAFGRYQNGKRVFGPGLKITGIDWANIAAWANVCEANAWTIFGRIFEPGDRYENLKEIARAGGGQPIISSSGRLSFRYHAPTAMLDTIRPEDLAEGPVKVTTMTSWAERVNTIIPRCVSPDHDWKQIPLGAIERPDLVEQDGEPKSAEWAFNLVKAGTAQPAQLAAYVLVDGRELNPIVIPCGPRLRHHRAGDGLRIELPENGLETDAIVLSRQFDPATLTTTFILIGETPEKHDFALGRTAVLPPVPALGQSAQERDELSAAALTPPGYETGMISTSYVTDADPVDGLLQASDTAITVETHSRTYADKSVGVAGAVLTVEDDGTTSITASTRYHVYYDDSARAGGAVALQATRNAEAAATGDAHPDRHYVGSITTDVTGGGGTSGGGAPPPGWGQGDWHEP